MVRILENTKAKLTAWKARNGINILRVTLGLVFTWFGLLKFFPGLSPAETLAGKTLYMMSFGYLKPAISIPVLATLECVIGIGLIGNYFTRTVLVLLYAHMAGTFLPLIFFPHDTWAHTFVPTLLGQYIIKNGVLIAAGIVIGISKTQKTGQADNEQPKLLSATIKQLKPLHSPKYTTPVNATSKF